MSLQKRQFELEQDVINHILDYYSSSFERESIFKLLNEYIEHQGTKSSRISRCVLFLANGDINEFIKYLELANKDWRDIIVCAENDENDTQIRDFTKPFT